MCCIEVATNKHIYIYILCCYKGAKSREEDDDGSEGLAELQAILVYAILYKYMFYVVFEYAEIRAANVC